VAWVGRYSRIHRVADGWNLKPIGRGESESELNSEVVNNSLGDFISKLHNYWTGQYCIGQDLTLFLVYRTWRHLGVEIDFPHQILGVLPPYIIHNMTCDSFSQKWLHLYVIWSSHWVIWLGTRFWAWIILSLIWVFFAIDSKGILDSFRMHFWD